MSMIPTRTSFLSAKHKRSYWNIYGPARGYGSRPSIAAVYLLAKFVTIDPNLVNEKRFQSAIEKHRPQHSRIICDTIKKGEKTHPLSVGNSVYKFRITEWFFIFSYCIRRLRNLAQNPPCPKIMKIRIETLFQRLSKIHECLCAISPWSPSRPATKESLQYMRFSNHAKVRQTTSRRRSHLQNSSASIFLRVRKLKVEKCNSNVENKITTFLLSLTRLHRKTF